MNELDYRADDRALREFLTRNPSNTYSLELNE